VHKPERAARPFIKDCSGVNDRSLSAALALPHSTLTDFNLPHAFSNVAIELPVET
jgi:hypothetical protein